MRRWLAIVLAVCLLVGGPLAWSYVSTVSVAGGGSLGARSVDWVRQMGGSRLVAWSENVWYGRNKPPTGGTPTAIVNGPVDSRLFDPPVQGASNSRLPHPPSVPSIAYPALPGEGEWHPIGRPVGHAPALYAAYMRPDPVHTSLTAGIVWMDPKMVSLRLVAGSQQPGGAGWQNEAPLPADVHPRLLATFNSGFRMSDGRGGYYEAGRTAKPLVDGAASLVILQDGSATVGSWGAEVGLTPDVYAVRQNLLLVVDGGQVTPQVSQDSLRSWGATVRNAILVWRSGIGVTPSGALVYVAGPGLSVQSLADLLVHAGCQRAMELDINSQWVNFISFNAPAGFPADAKNGSNLLPDMNGPTGRYLGPSTRDFFAVVARPS